MKEIRNNQAIFTDYCSLCLEKLRNEPFQEIKTENTENDIIISREGIKAGCINTFNYGYQFHAKCITQFKIGECPICK